MSQSLELNTLLAPIDFSPASKAAFEQALRFVTGPNPVLVLLHVIDDHFVRFATEHGFGAEDEVRRCMRNRAVAELREYQQLSGDDIEVDVLVSEGTPFLEILAKAEDFAVDAIVIGKVGSTTGMEKLLFGSTAEKVLRGSRIPVIVLPLD